MARLYLKRTLAGFAAADEPSADLMRKFAVGAEFRADVVKPRNLKTHKRYWALVNMVYQNTDQFTSTDQVHQFLKLRAGHCDQIVSKSTGEIYLIAKSISFDSLDDTEFYAIYQRMLDVVVQDILPGIALDEVAYEIEKLIGIAA